MLPVRREAPYRVNKSGLDWLPLYAPTLRTSDKNGFLARGKNFGVAVRLCYR